MKITRARAKILGVTSSSLMKKTNGFFRLFNIRKKSKGAEGVYGVPKIR